MAREARISGGFTKGEAEDLADTLRYGALPVALEPENVNSISPTLGRDQLRMRRRSGFPVIRQLADIPQPLDCGRRPRHVAHLGIADGMVEHADVLGDRRTRQRLVPGRQRKRRLQRAKRGEIQL